MIIGGEKTVELDFVSCFIRMLYHSIEWNPNGDLYRPEVILPQLYAEDALPKGVKKMARGFIKRATNICFNVNSRAAANSAVSKLLRDSGNKFLA